EVGCGFGWDAVALSLIGDNEVVATDILPSMIDGVSQCLAAMEAKGRPLSVRPLQGDICRLDLPDASFDGIFSSEAIEHVHDLGDMFDNIRRLLEPSGTAVIVNDSNRYNAAARALVGGMDRTRRVLGACGVAEVRGSAGRACRCEALWRDA